MFTYASLARSLSICLRPAGCSGWPPLAYALIYDNSFLFQVSYRMSTYKIGKAGPSYINSNGYNETKHHKTPLLLVHIEG